MIQSPPSSFNNFSDNNSSKANSSQADLPMDQAAVVITPTLTTPIVVVKLKELPDKEKDTGVKIEATVPSSKDPVIKEEKESKGNLFNSIKNIFKF